MNLPYGFWFFAIQLSYGLGIEEDKNLAISYFLQAAQKGCKQNAFWLSEDYSKGINGFPKSEEDSQYFLELFKEREYLDEEYLLYEYSILKDR